MSTNIQEMSGSRDRVIVRTSLIGIGANLALAGGKAVAGLLAHSIAVVLDAVNNLSDAMSSLITIIATKLAGRAPDKKHPLGYGRIEYLSTMIIAAIVLYAGVTALIESVKKIINPETPDYSALTLAIIAVAVAAKVLLGLYFRKVGKQVNSGSLQASGSDALSDAILSASVLLSAIVYLTTGLSLEAWVGVLIAIFIIRAGYEMMTEAVDDLLGKRLDRETAAAIKKTICDEPEVEGAYDLFLNNYGPERVIGSVHVEVPDTMTAGEIDSLERRIAHKVFEEHGIVMTAIGIYAVNTTDDRIAEMRTRLTRMIMSHDGILQVHGFTVNDETKVIQFDVIVDYARTDRKEIFDHIAQEAAEMYPDYTLRLVMDIDI
ncbi:MAG: cation transporter [Clostridia bacterium]|nr:cation transporter [Clostridia bacterium]